MVTPQLDFVLVQNHAEAMEVIGFLNSKKLGRMSLLLMDEIDKLTVNITPEWNAEQVMPKGCTRMYDMIKVMDTKHKKLLFWCVGNTLIADTVDDAMKAAYHSSFPYRVIAKNGVFIDYAGTMTKLPVGNKQQEDRELL